ncbi:response regulator transcription factor [Nonomuraea sp. NPDC051191]|uniref:response regulator transcription factor n=1 Tax=Nonomuraea sp. NPDC051191 TaxID=3364372 RepID=UPI0037AF7EC8
MAEGAVQCDHAGAGQRGQGLTNQQIASRLNIAEATVKSHLGRLMAKLKLSSRAQAVVIAYETGLIVPGAGDRT